MMRNIGVIGVGGVGGFFGARLCEAREERPDLQVHFIARGDHLAAIRARGLLLKAQGKPDLVCRPDSVSDRIEDLPPLDLCLLCVKQFDLTATLERLRPAVRAETIVLPLLNGMDVHARIRRVIREGIVLPACVYIGTHIESAGVVAQSGGACRILLGPDPGRPEFVPESVLELFRRAAIRFEWKAEVQSDIWEKFIFIAACGLVTATSGRTTGEVLQDADLTARVTGVMRETVALARKLEISLPGDIVKQSIQKAATFPFETKTSFQRDFERADKPDERDLFAGAILQLGAERGVPTPITRQLADEIAQRKPATWPSAESG